MLIKFLTVGQMAFGDSSQDAAPVHKDSAVKKLTAFYQRAAYDHQHVSGKGSQSDQFFF
jgi:hypothetical protein